MQYGVIWHPVSQNLGDDIQAYAAGCLLPKIDVVLDGDRLDEAPLRPEDATAILLSGSIMRSRYHWPPHPALRPVCLGVHLSREDVWGARLDTLSGLGLDYWKAHGPVGCRDEATAALLSGMGVENYVSCCLTLTLERPADVPRRQRYVCCVDVPDKVIDSLRRYEKAEHIQLREMTHQLPPKAAHQTYAQRMAQAEATLRVYAGAAWVVTRRLHCALACLALEVPVLLLYNSGYEDVRRFSPMDGLFAVASVEDFTEAVRMGGFPKLAENPEKYLAWRRILMEKAAQGLAQLTDDTPSSTDREAVAAWQHSELTALAERAAEKIDHLEKEQYDLIHDKFGLLLTEDSVKSRIQDCLAQPGLEDTLRAYAEKLALSRLPWWKRRAAKRRFRRLCRAHESIPELDELDPLNVITGQLARLGWPVEQKDETH